MTRAANFKPSLMWGGIALGSIFLCSVAAFADEALWKMYVETGTNAYKDGRYPTAETMFLAARTEAEGFGSNDLRLASTLFQLARVYDAENVFEKAEPNYLHAIKIWDTASAPGSIEFANALNELANLYASHRDDTAAQQAAQQWYKRALEIREKLTGPANPDLIIPLTNLAGNLRDQKKYDEAEPVYKRAQDIAEKYFDRDDVKVAGVLSKEAGNFLDEEKYSEAKPLYERALAIMEINRSSEDLDVVGWMERLAVTLFELKKFSQARPIAERAIAILEKNNEPGRLAAPLTFLGRTWEGLGKYDDAERAYKKALSALDKGGSDNNAALETLENYSRMLRDLKREPEARPYEARIDKIRGSQKQ